MSNTKLTQYAYRYLLFLSSLSVLLHVLGIFQMAVGDAPTTSHVVMMVLDSVLLAAVIARGRIAWFFTLGMFIYGVSSQTYWTIEAIVKNYDQPYLQGLTAALCWLALACVFRCRSTFFKKCARDLQKSAA